MTIEAQIASNQTCRELTNLIKNNKLSRTTITLKELSIVFIVLIGNRSSESKKSRVFIILGKYSDKDETSTRVTFVTTGLSSSYNCLYKRDSTKNH